MIRKLLLGNSKIEQLLAGRYYDREICWLQNAMMFQTHVLRYEWHTKVAQTWTPDNSLHEGGAVQVGAVQVWALRNSEHQASSMISSSLACAFAVASDVLQRPNLSVVMKIAIPHYGSIKINGFGVFLPFVN